MVNETSQTVTLSLADYQQLCRQVLIKSGVTADIADEVIEALLWCDLHGVSSHGMNMLPTYLERLKSGGIVGNARPSIVLQKGALVQLDANGGFGQVAGRMAADMASDLADEHGVGVVSVRNSNHAGALSCFTGRIAEKGKIGFLAHNVNPAVAPFGGAQAAIGTNPLSFAFPGNEFPILVDMATSATAKGKLYALARKSDTIPPDLALDKNGMPTTSVADALKGILLPLGGPKGYALAVAVEILAGVISGGRIVSEIPSFHNSPDRPQGTSMFMLAIDPGCFISESEYKERIAQLTAHLKGTRPAANVESVLMPGEIEARMVAKRQAEGVPLPETLVEDVRHYLSGEK